MTEIVNITDRERAKDRLIAQLSAGRDALAARLDKVRADLAQAPTTLSVAKSIAAEQADDPSLWFVATTATEAHLQHALRHLAAAVEGTLVSSAQHPEKFTLEQYEADQRPARLSDDLLKDIANGLNGRQPKLGQWQRDKLMRDAIEAALIAAPKDAA